MGPRQRRETPESEALPFEVKTLEKWNFSSMWTFSFIYLFIFHAYRRAAFLECFNLQTYLKAVTL